MGFAIQNSSVAPFKSQFRFVCPNFVLQILGRNGLGTFASALKFAVEFFIRRRGLLITGSLRFDDVPVYDDAARNEMIGLQMHMHGGRRAAL